MADYVSVVIFGIIGVMMPVLFIIISKLLRPRKPTPLKYTTYECGEKPIGEARTLSFQYYVFAILFVVFDIVSVFLYPWALISVHLKFLAIFQMLAFLVILYIGVFYSLRKEGATWI